MTDTTKTELSRAIGLSRILLVVGLVFLHYGIFPNGKLSPFLGLDMNSHQFATWLNSTVLFFFFASVPLLSMISGWLFFSFKDEPIPALKRRIKSRFFSLYLPLIVFNLGYLLLLYAVYRVNPNASFFANNTRININLASAGAWDYINAITGITDTPVAFQFWFVRDLFVTVLISPLLWLALRYAPLISAVILGAIWLSAYDTLIFVRFDVPFFFYMGGLVRMKNLPIIIPQRTTIYLFVLFVILASLRALAPYVIGEHVDGVDEPFWLETVTRLMRIVGVLGCWGVIYRVAQTTSGEYVSRYGGLAFFLHSAHWPLLAIVKVAVWKFTPAATDFWMIAHWITSVAVTISICLIAGIILARFFPRIFSLMNGGRLLTQ